MKTTLKTFGRSITLLLFVTFVFSKAKAQSHNKAAANCLYHEEFVKNSTKKVAAVDGFCKICGNKKEEDRKKKLAAEKAAAEQKGKQQTEKQKQDYAKALAEQKKKAEAQKQKAKNNEVILGAPKQRTNSSGDKPTATQKKEEVKNKDEQTKSGYNPNLETFSDYDKREYGLKLNDKIVFSKPKGDFDVSTYRIKETNYFVINFSSYNEDYRKTYSQILDKDGNVLKIDGYDKFHYPGRGYDIKYNSDTFELIAVEEPFVIGSNSRGTTPRRVLPQYLEKEWFLSVSDAVGAFMAVKNTQGTVKHIFTAKCTILKVDRNLKVLEKKSGITYALVHIAVTDEEKRGY